MPKYQPGQKWSYRTRPCDVGSTLIIGAVQSRILRSPVIHISVADVHSDASLNPTQIGHMPFTSSAMDRSVLEMLDASVEIESSFREGYSKWSENKGGVFDLSVAEAVGSVLAVIGSQSSDPFDTTVLRMRAERSEAMIDELYRQLFRLHEWYFLCDPGNPRVPVEWVFPEGQNNTPALLAFTSRERAVSAAETLGIYPTGSAVSVMPAPVRSAVEWVTGPDCANTWICFNLTFENFPLYCDHAAKLLAAR